MDVTTIHSASDLSPTAPASWRPTARALYPLNMRLNLQVPNFNGELAALNALDYKVLADNNEIATGATTRRIEVPANSTAAVTLPITTDARKVVADGGAEALGDFALGLADRDRQPTRVTIAVRPSGKFLGGTIKSPDYITVDQDVTARQLLNDRATRRDLPGTTRP